MAKKFGFYLVIYLLIMLVVGVGYPFAQRYAQPIVAIIFPINPDTSLFKNMVVISAMYWGMVLLVSIAMKKKQG
ncbi:MAG TPA: hypothetical protein V6C99_06900 [Oculatellaceae cyanobacterium]